MHNGKVGNWQHCRKDVEDLIDHVHYPHREGTTDSEALFLVALSNGLVHDPVGAMAKTLQDVSRIMDRHHADEPMRISCALTNGHDIWAFRYSAMTNPPACTLAHPTPAPWRQAPTRSTQLHLSPRTRMPRIGSRSMSAVACIGRREVWRTFSFLSDRLMRQRQ